MLIVFVIFSLFIFSKNALASQDFNINQQINYRLTATGNATVSQTTSLTNNYSEIYAKQYQVILSGSNIKNITGSDSQGNIINYIDQQKESTTITLEFNKPGIGKDQSTQFTLNYTIENLAVKKGRTWEILLPNHKSTNPTDKTKITLNIPQDFGKLSFSSIKNPTIQTINSIHTIKINQPTPNQKILFIFGDYQTFDFILNYYLDNPSTDLVQSQIPIPPDTPSQKIIYRQISPPPQNITIDADGNWLAQYLLEPNQKIDILVDGQVTINPATSQAQPIDIATLTKTQPYWPVDNPQIQKIAQTLNSPKNIYDFVVSSLDYNYDLIDNTKRQGALFALQNPDQSLCTEFTDLFITLARAKGIPAREVEGYAFTNNPKIKPTNINADILHAWPQYYNQKLGIWISIDPTWAKTTKGIDYFNHLDLNHFAFVFHGHDSLYPPPPGSYKDNRQAKTISVNFSNQELSSDIKPPQLSNQKNQLVIKNENLEALTQLEISLSANNWRHHISTLPPLASVTIPLPKVSFLHSLLPQNQKLNFTIHYQNNQTHQLSLDHPSHYQNLILSIAALMFILSTGGIILTIRKKHQT